MAEAVAAARRNLAPPQAVLFLLRIGGLLKFALADHRSIVRRDLILAVEFNVVFVGFLDFGDADNMFRVGDFGRVETRRFRGR